MTNSPKKGRTDPVDAVLNQYAGAEEEHDDLRGNLSHVEVVPGVVSSAPVEVRQKYVRHKLYPNLGSADSHDSSGVSVPDGDYLD
jgi:hypothetical protein